MPVHNADIANVFEDIADLLEIGDANPFRVRAYRNAARLVQGMGRPIADMIARHEDLTELPGVGDDLADKITEIVRTGKCKTLERLRKQMPPTITELLKIPGLGPKRVRTLYEDLDVHTLPQLARAARAGRIRALPGFGVKTEQIIRETIEARVPTPGRFKAVMATQYAKSLQRYLEAAEGVQQVTVAGSYRRCKESVGDLDLVVAATNPAAVMNRFIAYEDVKDILSKGATRSTVALECGLQVDVRVVAPECFGAALQYFTGSKAHNIELRRIAQDRGLKINEYGVFRRKRRIAGDSEESVYRAVDLPWIAPELRENRGEVEAARAGKLPKLVALSDLKGDLHAHTKATDGHHTVEQMAEAARARGLQYLAITEHSQRLTMAQGFDRQRLRQQMEEIDRFNAAQPGIVVLKGIEVDILEDGALDLPDDILGELDIVVGAVHSQFGLSRLKQTERVLRAMDHPHFHILAHPTGRLLDERAPCDIDMLKVVRHARARGCSLELNAQPERLDLLDVYCRMAKEEGVLVAVNSDAHGTQEFDNLSYGIGQARRGWLEAKDVLNARPLDELLALLRQHRAAQVAARMPKRTSLRWRTETSRHPPAPER